MLVKMYSVYDKAGRVFMAPFCCHTDELALRMLSDAVADNKTMLSAHPESFDLFLMTSFDDNSGAFEPVFPPQHIGSALQFASSKG